MTQFKVGDRVLVDGTIIQLDIGGDNEHKVQISGVGSFWVLDEDIHPLPSPPAAVDVLVVQPEETYTEWRKREGRTNPAQGCPPPTATEVTQATAVFAGMERQRLWVEFAVGYMKAKCYRANSTFDDYAGDCATMADAMLAKFRERFKGGA